MKCKRCGMSMHEGICDLCDIVSDQDTEYVIDDTLIMMMRMKHNGLTYTQIGEKVGKNPTRVNQMIFRAIDRQKNKDKNALMKMKYIDAKSKYDKTKRICEIKKAQYRNMIKELDAELHELKSQERLLRHFRKF